MEMRSNTSFIQKLRQEVFHPSKRTHGAESKSLYPWDQIVSTPFKSSMVNVKPFIKTTPQLHHEAEVLFIIKGQGRAYIDEEIYEVSFGDTLYLPPFIKHSVENIVSHEDLTYISIWWEDAALHKKLTHQTQDPKNKKIHILSPLPTPNGDLHVGHLAGPYLAADACARYLKLKGRSVKHISGLDEHQSYPALQAKKMSTSTHAIIEEFCPAIRDSLKKLGITHDEFVRPTLSKNHEIKAKAIFSKLYSAGKIYVKKSTQFYCSNCSIYVYEAFLKGNCPYCFNESSGWGCENCVRFFEESSLVDPICNVCNQQPELKEVERLYFALSEYQKNLKSLYYDIKISPFVRRYLYEVLANPLPDIPISHYGDWGTAVDLPRLEGQRFYARFEMLARYFAGIPENNISFAEKKSVEIVLFFGFDNAFARGVVFPALLLAYDEKTILPKAFIANYYYNLEGKKFSTSRKHTVHINELLEKTSIDATRFFLALDRPETRETNFTFSNFIETINKKLEPLVKWLNGLHYALVNDFKSFAPEAGLWLDY
jgi:methionyl-tRNA synthetase